MNGNRRFRCRPESVSAARRFVREMLRDQPRETVDAAELMASELASNCVRHAHTDFELVISARGSIRVEVRDTGDGRPKLRSPTPQEPTGRGLLIVEAMSDSWGIVPSAAGKTVWFTLEQQREDSDMGFPSDASSGLDSEGRDRAVRSRGLRRMLMRRKRDADPSMCSHSRACSRSSTSMTWSSPTTAVSARSSASPPC